MAKTVSIGTQSFEFLRENDCFYVDKTGLIREWWENMDAVTMIARPRRFGKSLNLDMLHCFFSRKYEGKGKLFEGLSIWKDEKYRKLQGSRPVIFLTFADIKGATLEETKEGLKYALAKLYEVHGYVRDGAGMGAREQMFFDSVSPEMTDGMAVLALQYLSDYMSRYYGQKVLIFLDEYDTPLQEAYVHGYWEEMVSFISRMFHSAFKSNPYLDRALMTGITRVSKESIFSDMNNLTVVTAASEEYCTQFGFTEGEVFQALEDQGMSEHKEKVKRWYDGFTFGSQRDVYNPWSIINYLKIKMFKPYWVNTSSNSLVSLLIRQGAAETKVIMEELLKGGTLETEIDEEIVFSQLGENEDAIWSLLLASGYLKMVESYFSKETRRYTYRLELTNLEVQMMFEKMIRGWFKGEGTPYNDFLKALLLGDVEAMNEFMNEIALATLSSFDIGRSAAKNDAPERLPTGKATTKSLEEPNSSVCFYHGFVLGLMVELADRYELTSNRESGFGRYDIMLTPRKMGEADPIVIEFKVRKPLRESSLQETAEAALMQIREKSYDASLMGRGYEKERIRHYGFAFEGKQVLIVGE